MDQEQAEKESSVYETPVHNENEVLVELAVGEALDCVVSEMQERVGSMSSPMLHGFEVVIGENDLLAVDQAKPFKMWASSSLEHAFKVNARRLIGLPIRIRRLSDVPVGTMFGKTFRISVLKDLLVRLAKDKIATK